MMPFETYLPVGMVRWIDIVDIAIVAVIIYYLLLWLQGTRALSLVRGFILILLIYIAGRFFGLYTVNWLFDRFAAIIAMMLVIIFQPEMRRMLERFGRGRFLGALRLASVPQGQLLCPQYPPRGRAAGRREDRCADHYRGSDGTDGIS